MKGGRQPSHRTKAGLPARCRQAWGRGRQHGSRGAAAVVAPQTPLRCGEVCLGQMPPPPPRARAPHGSASLRNWPGITRGPLPWRGARAHLSTSSL